MDTAKHRSSGRSRCRRAVAALGLLAGCNALLDNDLRTPDGGEQGGFPGSAGSSDAGNGSVGGSGGAGGLDAGGLGAGGSAGTNGGGVSGGASNVGGANVDGTAGDHGGAAGGGSCEGECVPDHVDTLTQACTCNRGIQSQSRICGPTCTWGEWGAFGACSVVAECQPNAAAQTRTVACDACGSQTQSRSCTNMCTWDAWKDTTACPNCDHCASVEWCTDPDTGGTTCKQEACTREQALRDCMLDIVLVCGATRQPFTMNYL